MYSKLLMANRKAGNLNLVLKNEQSNCFRPYKTHKEVLMMINIWKATEINFKD